MDATDSDRQQATATVPEPGSKERPWNTPGCMCKNCAATATHPETGLWPVCNNMHGAGV